jgi:hypothetical protein
LRANRNQSDQPDHKDRLYELTKSAHLCEISSVLKVLFNEASARIQPPLVPARQCLPECGRRGEA